MAAEGRRIETEAAPIRYVAEFVGADTDSERAIRWLIALMVLRCDPLAIALTAAASARKSMGGDYGTANRHRHHSRDFGRLLAAKEAQTHRGEVG